MTLQKRNELVINLKFVQAGLEKLAKVVKEIEKELNEEDPE